MSGFINPKDPIAKSGPEHQLELFHNLVECSRGRTTEQVIGAAINLLVNAVRQSQPTRMGASMAMDEMTSKAHALLLDHYDSVSGKRRNVFPHTQVISMPHLIDRDR